MYFDKARNMNKELRHEPLVSCVTDFPPRVIRVHAH